MKRKLWIIATVVLAVAVLIVWRGIETSQRKAALSRRAEDLLERGKQMLEQSVLDSAEVYLSDASRIREADWRPPASYVAEPLLQEVKDFAVMQQAAAYRDALTGMSDDEYKMLVAGRLEKPYFANPTLNRRFIEALYSNRAKRAGYVAEQRAVQARVEREERASRARAEREQKAQEREERLAAEQEGAVEREMFEESLRNAFLDDGLDIEVKVSGKNNTRLTLTYALFSDVWVRQFQTSDYVAAWHEMGFTRIDFTDGYDYHKYVYWKTK